MKRPGALWLLRHELRLGLRGLSGGSPYGPILIAVGAVVWTMVSWVFAAPIAKILPPFPFPPSTGLLTALLVISAGLAASACLMLSQAITITVSQIYTRNDLSLLFSSPVKPWTVLVVRATSIAMQVCQTYVLLAGPAIVCLAVSHSPVWLFALACIVLLGVMSTGVGLLIVLWLFRTIGPKLTKTIAQIFSVIIGASIFLAFQAYNIGRSFDLLELPKRASSIIKDPDVLWLLPARAVLGRDLPGRGLSLQSSFRIRRRLSAFRGRCAKVRARTNTADDNQSHERDLLEGTQTPGTRSASDHIDRHAAGFHGCVSRAAAVRFDNSGRPGR